MRIKKKYLNEESLKPYGFEKKVLYEDLNIVEYKKINEEQGETILIQRRDGRISLCLHAGDFDCVDIDNVLYHLIKDGLVEI